MSTAIPYTRLNITMPKNLADELKKTTPNISKFISDAVEERISYERRMKAIEELSKMPPTFTHIKDPAKYIHDMRRKETKKRDKKIGLK